MNNHSKEPVPILDLFLQSCYLLVRGNTHLIIGNAPLMLALRKWTAAPIILAYQLSNSPHLLCLVVDGCRPFVNILIYQILLVILFQDLTPVNIFHFNVYLCQNYLLFQMEIGPLYTFIDSQIN